MVRLENTNGFLTRNRAMKKLGISLMEFRRLCILTGIYPITSKRKHMNSTKLYYSTKDMAYISRHPLMETIRNTRRCTKKVNKYPSNKNANCMSEHKNITNKLSSRTQHYRLEYLVRERYPSFIEALRDIDDCLSLINLFATLPANKNTRVSNEVVEKCRLEALEFNAYVILTHSLRRSFISVKGIYCQAEIMGHLVTWIVPHKLGKDIPNEIDFRVIESFLEFYIPLIQSIKYRLFNDIGIYDLESPKSKLRNESDVSSLIFLLAEYEKTRPMSLFQHNIHTPANYPFLKKQVSLQNKVGLNHPNLSKNDNICSNILKSNGSPDQKFYQTNCKSVKIESKTNSNKRLSPLHNPSNMCELLFKNMIFYVSREVAHETIILVILALGGKVAFDGPGSPYSVWDDSITHQVIDRPISANLSYNRIFIQPQWIFDCLNFNIRIPTDLYAPGKLPPPHLSPFTNQEDIYAPKASHQTLETDSNKCIEKNYSVKTNYMPLPKQLDNRDTGLQEFNKTHSISNDYNKLNHLHRERKTDNVNRRLIEDVNDTKRSSAHSVLSHHSTTIEPDIRKAVLSRKPRKLYHAMHKSLHGNLES